MDIAEFVEVVTSPATAVMDGEAVQQQRTSSQAVFVKTVLEAMLLKLNVG